MSGSFNIRARTFHGLGQVCPPGFLPPIVGGVPTQCKSDETVVYDPSGCVQCIPTSGLNVGVAPYVPPESASQWRGLLIGGAAAAIGLFIYLGRKKPVVETKVVETSKTVETKPVARTRK